MLSLSVIAFTIVTSSDYLQEIPTRMFFDRPIYKLHYVIKIKPGQTELKVKRHLVCSRPPRLMRRLQAFTAPCANAAASQRRRSLKQAEDNAEFDSYDSCGH